MCNSNTWPILVQIIDENSDALDDSIKFKIMNIGINKIQRTIASFETNFNCFRLNSER